MIRAGDGWFHKEARAAPRLLSPPLSGQADLSILAKKKQVGTVRVYGESECKLCLFEF